LANRQACDETIVCSMPPIVNTIRWQYNTAVLPDFESFLAMAEPYGVNLK
jgi:hypothetical protein